MIEQDISSQKIADRLRKFVREHAPGGCRLLSQGHACECPLCDIDRLHLRAIQTAATVRAMGEGRT